MGEGVSGDLGFGGVVWRDRRCIDIQEAWVAVWIICAFDGFLRI